MAPKSSTRWNQGSVARLRSRDSPKAGDYDIRTFPEGHDSGWVYGHPVVLLGYDTDGTVIVAALTTRGGKCMDGMSPNAQHYYLPTSQVLDLSEAKQAYTDELLMHTCQKKQLEKGLVDLSGIFYIEETMLLDPWGKGVNEAKFCKGGLHRILDRWNSSARPANVFTFNQYIYCRHIECNHPEKQMRNLRPPSYSTIPQPLRSTDTSFIFFHATASMVHAATATADFKGPMSLEARSIVSLCAVRITSGLCSRGSVVLDDEQLARTVLIHSSDIKPLLTNELLELFRAKVIECENCLSEPFEAILPAMREARRRLLPDVGDGAGHADWETLKQYFTFDEAIGLFRKGTVQLQRGV